MAIKFIPYNTQVTLYGQEQWEQAMLQSLGCLRMGLDRLEVHLELLTELELKYGDIK